MKASEPLKNAVVVRQNLIPQGAYDWWTSSAKEARMRLRRTIVRWSSRAVAIAVSAVILGVAGSVRAGDGVPCYEISATIQGPNCGGFAALTVGTAINSQGHVAGYWERAPFCAVRPFIWKPETGLVLLSLPPWLTEAYAWGINDNGWICGTGSRPGVGQRGWVRTDAGQWIELLPLNPPIGWSGAHAINNHNVVCGYRSIGSPNDPVNPSQAFIWSAGLGFTDLGLVNDESTNAYDLNDAGWTTGTMAAEAGGAEVAYLWRGKSLEQIGPLVPGFATIALDVNSSQGIVGGAYIPTGDPKYPHGIPRAIKAMGGHIVDLGLLDGDWLSWATVQDKNGLVGGLSRPPYGVDIDHAVLWDDEGIHQVDNLVPKPQGLRFIGIRGFDSNERILTDTYVFQIGSQGAAILQPLPINPGDVDRNCRTDIFDLLFVVSEWGKPDSPADTNGDNTVNVADLLIVIQYWTS